MAVTYPVKYPFRQNRIKSNKSESFTQLIAQDLLPMTDAVNDLDERISAVEDGTAVITEIEVGDGTVAAPSMTFESDSDTGIYRIGANNMGVAANGAKVLDIATTGLGVTGVMSASGKVSSGAGTVTSPGVVIGASDNGWYEVSATQQGMSIGNALVGGFDASGIFTGTISEQVGGVGVTVDGVLLKDGHSGAVNTATATAAGLTTGALLGSDQFVTVTSASANDVICLPAEATTPIGTIIEGWVGANGFELRPIAAEAATTTINNVTTDVEAAIPATTLFKVKKVAANTWILTAVDELGAVIAAIVPDAI